MDRYFLISFRSQNSTCYLQDTLYIYICWSIPSTCIQALYSSAVSFTCFLHMNLQWACCRWELGLLQSFQNNCRFLMSREGTPGVASGGRTCLTRQVITRDEGSILNQKPLEEGMAVQSSILCLRISQWQRSLAGYSP